MTIFLFLAAVIPALLLMYWFWKSDRFPEPSDTVWQTFSLGVLSLVPAGFLSVAVDAAIPASAVASVDSLRVAFLVAAIPEDVSKFMVLFFFAARSVDFDEPMDGLVYGAAASMGFAAFENVAYVLEGGWGVAVARAVTSVPSHCLHGAIMGYFIALYVLDPQPKKSTLFKALWIPILLHGLYDFPLLWLRFEWITLGVIAVEWMVVIRLMGRLRSEQVHASPAAGGWAKGADPSRE